MAKRGSRGRALEAPVAQPCPVSYKAREKLGLDKMGTATKEKEKRAVAGEAYREERSPELPFPRSPKGKVSAEGRRRWR